MANRRAASQQHRSRAGLPSCARGQREDTGATVAAGAGEAERSQPQAHNRANGDQLSGLLGSGPRCFGRDDLTRPLRYFHLEYMSTTKEERLQVRVDPADKLLLERAAAASHLNVSAFVVQAAASKAEEILADRSSIRLSAQAAGAFSEALERPAQVNDRLTAALGRKRKFSWLD
jgi:uncharacterized protein (DUF1778 family)